MGYFEVRVDRDGLCLERHTWFGDDEGLERLCSELSAAYPGATVRHERAVRRLATEGLNDRPVAA